jgi:hypothetical protein
MSDGDTIGLLMPSDSPLGMVVAENVEGAVLLQVDRESGQAVSLFALDDRNLVVAERQTIEVVVAEKREFDPPLGEGEDPVSHVVIINRRERVQGEEDTSGDPTPDDDSDGWERVESTYERVRPGSYRLILDTGRIYDVIVEADEA